MSMGRRHARGGRARAALDAAHEEVGSSSAKPWPGAPEVTEWETRIAPLKSLF